MPPRIPERQQSDQLRLRESASIVPAATPLARPEDAQPIGRRKGETASAAVIAQRAKAELQAITGLDVDHVSAVANLPDGWHVTVDLVELRRIPAATDVLAAYEAVLGPTGTLLSYHRTRRYFRDQTIEET